MSSLPTHSAACTSAPSGCCHHWSPSQWYSRGPRRVRGGRLRSPQVQAITLGIVHRHGVHRRAGMDDVGPEHVDVRTDDTLTAAEVPDRKSGRWPRARHHTGTVIDPRDDSSLPLDADASDSDGRMAMARDVRVRGPDFRGPSPFDRGRVVNALRRPAQRRPASSLQSAPLLAPGQTRNGWTALFHFESTTPHRRRGGRSAGRSAPTAAATSTDGNRASLDDEDVRKRARHYGKPRHRHTHSYWSARTTPPSMGLFRGNPRPRTCRVADQSSTNTQPSWRRAMRPTKPQGYYL